VVKYYAGIGSRDTPEGMLEIIRGKAELLGLQGWTLNSGGAGGADTYFDKGAAKHPAQIFLPYDGFNKHKVDGVRYILDMEYREEASAIASRYHPYWDNLNEYDRRFHTRNTHQVLGRDLKTPVSFVLCWTYDEGVGGTSQAIRVAKAHHIPVFNLKTTDFKGVLF
jgi:hypothetical protein